MGIFDRLFSGVTSTKPQRQAPAPFRPQPIARLAGRSIPPGDNQFNYPGSYVDYFAHVFREDFPEYRVTHEQRKRSTVFTFLSPDGRQALTAEIMPDSSEAKKLRRECAAMGIPYVRFYYDHEGWWNTRAYVNDRVRNALR